MWSNDRPTTPGFYWCHQRGKTRIVHIWCYKNGTELFTNEDGGASIKDTLYDGTQWMAAVIPPNPQDQNESAQPAPKAVAYLDLGTGGYMDIGTDLTDEALAALPKGRHMLGIVGTYGVDGYVPAQPAPSVPDGVAEALQRLIENGAVLGPSSSEDALLVARYRQHLLSSAPSVSTPLLVAIVDLVAQMEIVSRVGFVDTPNDKDSCAAFCVAEGTWLELMSAVESLASALAAAPEAKP